MVSAFFVLDKAETMEFLDLRVLHMGLLRRHKGELSTKNTRDLDRQRNRLGGFVLCDLRVLYMRHLRDSELL